MARKKGKAKKSQAPSRKMGPKGLPDAVEVPEPAPEAVRGPEPAAVGCGFDVLLDQDCERVLAFARKLASGEVLPVQPATRTLRGEIVQVLRARNGSLGLALNRKWPTPGAVVIWLSPSLAQRIRFPPEQLIGLTVEARGAWFTTDYGKTIATNISDPGDLRFVYPNLPGLP